MRKRMLFVTLVAGALLVPAATVWACTNLATLNLSEVDVSAGDTVDITGTSFSSMAQESPGEGGEFAEPVELRWASTDGEVIAEFDTNENGTFQGSFEVPADAEPGNYVLVATQEVVADAEDDDVRAAYGTPARASLNVDAPAVEAPEIGTPAVTTAASAPFEPGLLSLGGLIGLGVLAIGLLGAGLGFFVRDLTRREQRVTEPAARK